jgi:hypothetical protein
VIDNTTTKEYNSKAFANYYKVLEDIDTANTPGRRTEDQLNHSHWHNRSLRAKDQASINEHRTNTTLRKLSVETADDIQPKPNEIERKNNKHCLTEETKQQDSCTTAQYSASVLRTQFPVDSKESGTRKSYFLEVPSLETTVAETEPGAYSPAPAGNKVHPYLPDRRRSVGDIVLASAPLISRTEETEQEIKKVQRGGKEATTEERDKPDTNETNYQTQDGSSSKKYLKKSATWRESEDITFCVAGGKNSRHTSTREAAPTKQHNSKQELLDIKAVSLDPQEQPRVPVGRASANRQIEVNPGVTLSQTPKENQDLLSRNSRNGKRDNGHRWDPLVDCKSIANRCVTTEAKDSKARTIQEEGLTQSNLCTLARRQPSDKGIDKGTTQRNQLKGKVTGKQQARRSLGIEGEPLESILLPDLSETSKLKLRTPKGAIPESVVGKNAACTTFSEQKARVINPERWDIATTSRKPAGPSTDSEDKYTFVRRSVLENRPLINTEQQDIEHFLGGGSKLSAKQQHSNNHRSVVTSVRRAGSQASAQSSKTQARNLTQLGTHSTIGESPVHLPCIRTTTRQYDSTAVAKYLSSTTGSDCTPSASIRRILPPGTRDDRTQDADTPKFELPATRGNDIHRQTQCIPTVGKTPAITTIEETFQRQDQTHSPRTEYKYSSTSDLQKRQPTRSNNTAQNNGNKKSLRKLNEDRTRATTTLTVLKQQQHRRTWYGKRNNKLVKERNDHRVNNTRLGTIVEEGVASRKQHHTAVGINVRSHKAQKVEDSEKGTLVTMIMSPSGGEDNGGDIADMEITANQDTNQQDHPFENDVTNTSPQEQRGLTESVDLTKTLEEITFESDENAHVQNNQTAFIHEELTTARKNIFPKHFINEGRQTIVDTEDAFFCYLTPMTVRIQSSKAITYSLERVLYSTLLALQHSDPTARLVVWDYERHDDVTTLDQVRRCTDLRPDNVKEFIEEPRTNQKSHSFTGRICLLSELSLTEIKQDDTVRAWLNKERVYLTENSLDTATTAAVGFITGWAPRAMADVHVARIRNEVPLAPGFLVEYKWLSEGPNIKAKFIVIRAAQRDVSKLVKVLMANNGKSDFIFHPWDHIMSLSKNQKRHFIQTETIFQQKHYSLLIKNVRPGIDDVTMQYSGTMNERGQVVTAKQALTQDKKQTVREFLLDHYRTWDGQQLFKTVHKEASGVIEVLVTEARFIEAKQCIEQIRQDMTCHMTAAASKASFDDYNLLQNRADHHIHWTAMDLSGYAENKRERTDSATPKRQRTATKATTYSNVTKSSKSFVSCLGGGRGTPISSLATVTETVTDNNPFMDLQIQNGVLTSRVAELEGIMKESHQTITSSFDNLAQTVHQENTSRTNEMEELKKWIRQSQSITTSALASLEKDVGTNEKVVQHLMTQTIPKLQHDVQDIKVGLADGFADIKHMFANMMNQNQGNSLHRADVDAPKDVKNKRNRSGSRSRKPPEVDGKNDNNRLDSNGKHQSGDSRDYDNLDNLPHSDHQMSGTGEKS